MSCSIYEAHLNDIGALIQFEIVDENDSTVSLVGATGLKVKARSPGGVAKVWTAMIIGDPDDGNMGYVTVDGDLNEVGMWTFQGYGNIGAWTGHTEAVTLAVYNVLS